MSGHPHLPPGTERGAKTYPEKRPLFRLDRVLSAEPLEEAFEPPPGLATPEEVLESLAAMRLDR